MPVRRRHPLLFAVSATLALAAFGATAAAQPVAAGTAPPASGPASAPTSPAVGDPFARLRVRIPVARLSPLRSVRVRNPSEARRGAISVHVKTSPSGASVTHGGRRLGETPLTITAERNSTPMDIVIRKRGYMILRTRIMRRVSRTYAFTLSPAKVH
jgi:hypothetical protein